MLSVNSSSSTNLKLYKPEYSYATIARGSTETVSRLIIHIGQTKTATTTIQYFLHHNQKQLEKWGLHYLARPENAHSHRLLYHVLHLETFADSSKTIKAKMMRLAKLGLIVPGQNPKEICEMIWEMLASSMPTSSSATALISEELLWHLGGFYHERRLALLHTLRHRLKKLVDPPDISVVACIRHQADWAESWHNQLVKETGNQTRLSGFIASLVDKGAFHYAKNLADWRSVFPEAEILVSDYHAQMLVYHNPEDALLSTCNLTRFIHRNQSECLIRPPILQARIHPFLHRWITIHKPIISSLEKYSYAVKQASEKVGDLAGKYFGKTKFTALRPNQVAFLNRFATKEDLSEWLDGENSLHTRMSECNSIPRPLPAIFQKIYRQYLYS